MSLAPIRKKDRVRILSGRDRNKEGDVIKVDSVKERVMVAKLNVVKKHAKATSQSPAGIRDKESWIPLCKVMLVCPKCRRATRWKLGTISDGTKARVCRRCGDMMG